MISSINKGPKGPSGEPGVVESPVLIRPCYSDLEQVVNVETIKLTTPVAWKVPEPFWYYPGCKTIMKYIRELRIYKLKSDYYEVDCITVKGALIGTFFTTKNAGYITESVKEIMGGNCDEQT